jgi:hypothetical protein
MKLILIFFIFLSFSFSQHVRANVSISAKRLTATEKDEIEELDEKIKDYINDFDWVETDIDDEIEVNIKLIIESVTDVSGGKRYKSQLFLQSSSGEKYYDKNVSFIYQQNDRLEHHSSEFKTLPLALDFYLALLLAGELDTYGEYLGEEQFVRAREALVKGKNSGEDWTFREKIFIDSTSPLVRTIRLAKLLYYSAQNELEDGEKERALKIISEMMRYVQQAYDNQANSLFLKQFFETYHKKLIELFDELELRDYINTLSLIDPVRTEIYNKYME